GADLRTRLRDRVHARDLRVHHHELDSAALLALAQPDPALPVRRLRAVPAVVPARPTVDGTGRPVADRGHPRALRARPHRDLHPREVPLEKGRARMALTPVEI